MSRKYDLETIYGRIRARFSATILMMMKTVTPMTFKDMIYVLMDNPDIQKR